jgi:hypothetical protein
MRYIRMVDEGYHARGDDWGDPTYWLEVNADGHAERELQEYPNGNVLSYDRTHDEDLYGGLALMVIDGPDDWVAEYEITQSEFEAKWRAHVPLNRGADQGLKSEVMKHVSLWDRQVVTVTETVGWLVDWFAFAVHDFLDARPAVAEALNSVPAPLIAGMAHRLAGCRRSGGGWHWPPGGPGLPNPGPQVPWRVADPAEAEALEVLVGWLRDRAGNG